MRPAAWLLLPFFLVIPGVLFGQSIRGVVVEDGTGDPAAGATIQLQVTARSNDRARQFYERARHGGQGRYITRDQIDRRVADRLSDLLRALPEVASGVDGSVRLRSLGDVCRPAVFLDGLLWNRDSVFDIDALIPTELIEGIEIYRNHVTAPVDMQLQAALAANDADPFTNLTCGIVAVWTRGPGGGPLTWKRFAVAAGVLAAMLLITR